MGLLVFEGMSMKVIAVIAALLVMLVAGCGRKTQQPAMTLPAELKKIHCQKDSKNYVEGHDFVRVAGTVVALRCVKQGTMKNAEQDLKAGKDTVAFRIYFMKTPEGEFLIGDSVGADLWPTAKEARYITTASATPDPSQSSKIPLDNRVEINVPTPNAFAASGAEMTFECSRPIGNGGACYGNVQSKALYWRVIVRFGWPYPKVPEMQVELAEVLNLLAAHIVKQD